MRSTSSLPSIPGPFGPGVVAPAKSPIYGLNRTKPWFLVFTLFFFVCIELRIYANRIV